MTAPQSIHWDVRTATGSLVTDLDTLADVLGSDRNLAAKTLLASPGHLTAPADLVREAQAQVEGKAFPPKPGGGTPPPISSGSFVSWSGGKGRVDLVVTNGKVPGITEDVEGSKFSPACRVVVWEKNGDGYKASGKKIGAMAKTLKRIPPLRSGKAAPATAATTLVEMMADHERRLAFEGLGPEAAVSGASVKAVYERGLSSWPGTVRTGLTRAQWGEHRVKSFMDIAAGQYPGDHTRDLGLLPPTHPMHPESKAIIGVSPSGVAGVDYVEIDQSELDARINDLLADD